MKQKTYIILAILLPCITALYAQTPTKALHSESFLDFESCKSVLTLHPMASDFIAGKEGVVLISTNELFDSERGYDYHTEYQQEDGIVKIKAVLPESHEDMPVYFRIVNPDIDDESSYEEDTTGGDNRDIRTINGTTAPYLGTLSESMGLAVLDGSGYAVVEVELTITNRYFGDNYQIEASLEANFSNAVRTTELIAWKRVYVEVDRMYRKGGTLTQDYDPESTVIFLDNVTDFVDLPEGAQLELFTQAYNDQAPIVVQILETNIEENSINIIEEAGFLFKRGSGVRILGQEEVIDAPVHLLKKAYGESPKGTDGGCFVEFVTLDDYSTNIPKFKKFENNPDGDTPMVRLLLSWRPNF